MINKIRLTTLKIKNKLIYDPTLICTPVKNKSIEDISLNIEKKIRDGWHKYPLRESGILHNEVAWRKSKLGFNSPEKTWINFYDNEMLKTISESNLMKKIISVKMNPERRSGKCEN